MVNPLSSTGIPLVYNLYTTEAPPTSCGATTAESTDVVPGVGCRHGLGQRGHAPRCTANCSRATNDGAIDVGSLHRRHHGHDHLLIRVAMFQRRILGHGRVGGSLWAVAGAGLRRHVSISPLRAELFGLRPDGRTDVAQPGAHPAVVQAE